MKFTCAVDINLSRDKVVALFKDAANNKEWQDGFQSTELIGGELGEVGAESLLKFKNGKRLMELKETILVSDLPNEFTGEFVHVHMSNTMQNLFTELNDNRTQWTANIEYTKLNSLSIKIIVKFFPKMFKKQTQKWLDQFKVFAEKN